MVGMLRIAQDSSGYTQALLKLCSGFLTPQLRHAYPQLRLKQQLLRPEAKTEPAEEKFNPGSRGILALK
jgi:hypothetical protein